MEEIALGTERERKMEAFGKVLKLSGVSGSRAEALEYASKELQRMQEQGWNLIDFDLKEQYPHAWVTEMLFVEWK